MLHYPYALYLRNIQHSQLLKNLKNDPLPIDLSDGSPLLSVVDVRDQKALQSFLEKKMTPNYSWGLGGYLERREMLLRYFPQMVQEKRFYHLGLDILVPLNTVLHAPLDAVVRVSDHEKGEGNYGGYMLLEHFNPAFETFYSLYGHLNPDSLAPTATLLKSGDPFARVGDFHQNGNWYYHTHLQIITKQGLAASFLHKGYCSRKDLAAAIGLCPNPLPLFKI